MAEIEIFALLCHPEKIMYVRLFCLWARNLRVFLSNPRGNPLDVYLPVNHK